MVNIPGIQGAPGNALPGEPESALNAGTDTDEGRLPVAEKVFYAGYAHAELKTIE